MTMQHSNWIAQALDHWKEHQPARYKELCRTGQLKTALVQAAEQTQTELEKLMGQGFKYQEAWEMVREQFLFPAEEPGASEEAPNSRGYRAMQAFNRELASVTLPGERED